MDAAATTGGGAMAAAAALREKLVGLPEYTLQEGRGGASQVLRNSPAEDGGREGWSQRRRRHNQAPGPRNSGFVLKRPERV